MPSTISEKTENTQKVLTCLEKVQQWPHWREIQLGAAKDSGMTVEQFYALLPEYQRYMALHAGYHGISMLSDQLDEIHHAMILNTIRYDGFCHSLIGRFVHHMPCSSYILYGVTPKEANTICEEPPATCTDPWPAPPDPSPVPDDVMRESILTGARRTFDAYIASYGAHPPLDIWNHAIAYL